MQADDAALNLQLSKWPFDLGDTVLVGIALAIGILGDWQLSDWQVLACVLSVALGAALFVLPYLVEYTMRIKEVREDRDAHIRVLRSHVQAAEAAIEALQKEVASRADSVAGHSLSNTELHAALDSVLDARLKRWSRCGRRLRIRSANWRRPSSSWRPCRAGAGGARGCCSACGIGTAS